MSLKKSLFGAVCFTLIAFDAQGFGTINGLGQQAEHEKITRMALEAQGWEPESLSALAGEDRRFGAVGAPDNPARLLLSNSAAHCDGGDYLALEDYPHSQAQAQAALEACRDWIFTQLENTVREAGAMLDDSGAIRSSQIPSFISCSFLGQSGRAKCNALEAFGLALHAAQDFYAHSNWSDAAEDGATSIENPPGLGRNGPAPWLDPAQDAPFPAGLMTGCFGLPESIACKGRVMHAVLNKDKGEIIEFPGFEQGRIATRRMLGEGRTPRGARQHNFARAARAAIEDTEAKWAYLQNRMRAEYGAARGARILCALISDRPQESCE